MPELLEVERYRAHAVDLVGRRVAEVGTPDAWYLKGGLDASTIRDVLVGARVVGVRRIGKLLLLDTERTTLGLRFGMTGRLIIDGQATIEHLEYGGRGEHEAWDRFWFTTSSGRGSSVHGSSGGRSARRREGPGELRMRDPRRLGGVELDPDESALGPDATGVTVGQLERLLSSNSAVKARLMDQRHLAGIGNLLADDILWRSRIDPARPARSLDADEVAQLRRSMRASLRVLGRRGGSHLGDLQGSRHADGRCPRDGTPLERRQIGGRTTYSCPRCQRCDTSGE